MADVSQRDLQIARDVATLEAYGVPATEAKERVAKNAGLSARRVYDICRVSDADVQQYAIQGGAMGEVGVSGLSFHRGYIDEEFLTELNTNDKRYKIFNEMRQNSPIVGSGLWAIELALRAVEWRIDGEEGDERVEFIDQCLNDMSHSWADHLSEALTMLAFGFSFFEIVYKRRNGEGGKTESNFDDGRVGWRKIAFRAQDSLYQWQFDDSGGIQGFVQDTFPLYEKRTIPIEKGLLYRTTREKNNPEGRSILRPAYVPYYYAKNLQAVEAIGAERDLAGLPMLNAPETADLTDSSDDYTMATNLLRRIRQDQAAGVLVPPGWEFDLISAAGSKQFNVGEIISRYEKRMALAMLTQFLMLGMDQVGTQALSVDLSDFFEMAISTFADNIADTFSKHAIKRLLRLNGMSTQDPPVMAHGPVGTPALEQMAAFFGQLGAAGFVKPTDDTEQYLRAMVHAPELTEEDIAEREARREAMPAPPPAPPQDMSIVSRYAQGDGNGLLKWMEQPGVYVDMPSHIITPEDIADAAKDVQRSGARVDVKKLLAAEMGNDG